MAFKSADFKKTTRTANNERLLYPYQIRDDRYTAAIGYAIGYYERMVGHRRAQFETDTLLEFFGDTRLARGLVACLARTYVWREQTFAEAFGETCAQTLWRAGISGPATLRARLYHLANEQYSGMILPSERTEALTRLCTDLPIDPAQLEHALTLDSQDQHILTKLGPTPEPHEIIASYNYHSLETALCQTERLQIKLHGSVWNIVRSLHNLTQRYRLRYEINRAPRTLFDDQIELTLYGARDALGNWSRTGRRLVRVLLRLLATHPDSLVTGEALVHTRSHTATLRLDARALLVLGIMAHHIHEDSEAWHIDLSETFRRAWNRAYIAGKTAGWRLRRDPEPLIGTDTIVVPDFALHRGHERLALCISTGRATTTALTRDLGRLGRRTPVIAILPDHTVETLRTGPIPIATYHEHPSEAIGALIATLERKHPRTHNATFTPWQRLEHRVTEEGFISEEHIATILNCSVEEAMRLLKRWSGPSLHILPGLGVCASDTLDEIRHLLEENTRAQRAA